MASEQLFSHTGDMTIRKRNTLGPVLLEHLVFNYANATMADIVSVGEAQVRAVRKELMLDA